KVTHSSTVQASLSGSLAEDLDESTRKKLTLALRESSTYLSLLWVVALDVFALVVHGGLDRCYKLHDLFALIHVDSRSRGSRRSWHSSFFPAARLSSVPVGHKRGPPTKTSVMRLS